MNTRAKLHSAKSASSRRETPLKNYQDDLKLRMTGFEGPHQLDYVMPNVPSCLQCSRDHGITAFLSYIPGSSSKNARFSTWLMPK